MGRTELRVAGVGLFLGVWVCLSAGAVPGWAQGHEPGEGEALLEGAARQMEEGQHGLAENSCQDVLAGWPGLECYARLTLAEVYADRGRLSEAILEAELGAGEQLDDDLDLEGIDLDTGDIDLQLVEQVLGTSQEQEVADQAGVKGHD